MFKFNLLPPERRRLKRVPLPYFISILILIVIISLGAIDLVFTVRNYKATLRKEKNLNEQKSRLSQKVREYDKLIEKKSRLENRLKFIQEVEARKFIVWTKKIDEFLDILQKFPKAWIESISMSVGGGEEIPEHKGKKILATFEIKMGMNTPNPSEILTFREAIKDPQNKLFEGFDYINDPAWNYEIIQRENAEPLKVFKFIIKLVKFQPEK